MASRAIALETLLSIQPCQLEDRASSINDGRSTRAGMSGTEAEGRLPPQQPIAPVGIRRPDHSETRQEPRG